MAGKDNGLDGGVWTAGTERRDRDRDRDRERAGERQRDRETERQRETEREGGRETLSRKRISKRSNGDNGGSMVPLARRASGRWR
jgi:hypothetical protein